MHAGTGEPVTVDIVYYERSRELRLVFDDVVVGKGVAVADSARGRDFDDLAHIVETPGWSLERVEDAMRATKYGDKVDAFRANLERFRRGEFDDDIRKSGFDPAFPRLIRRPGRRCGRGTISRGGVAERPNALALKARDGQNRPGVQIPPPPQGRSGFRVRG